MSLKLSLLLAVALLVPQLTRADLLVKDGQKVAFLGDSITDQGWNVPGGYVHLVTSGLATLGVHITPIPAGVSGNTSQDMLGRIDRDVISKKPDWMTLSCGVNDVWHGPSGVALEPYKQNITQIVDKCTAAGIKVLIMTATVIGEDLPNDNNQKLIAYNDWLRQFAKERNLPLAEENGAFQTAIKAAPPEPWGGYRVLTNDGVHPGPDGHELMAKQIIQGFGATDAQLAQVESAWLTEPGSATVNVAVEFPVGAVTLGQWKKIKALGDAHGHTPFVDYARNIYFEALRQAFAAHANDNPPASQQVLQADASARFSKMIDASPNP
jgi:lysophospholipase L1-like esterase